MSSRNRFSLMVSVVLFAGCSLFASINDHFNNGSLDPAWQVTLDNASGWTYTESGTNLTVTDIAAITTGSWSSVYLRQNFSASGDFEIKTKISWDSESTLATMQTIGFQAYNGTKKVIQGGYCDSWTTDNGSRYAGIEDAYSIPFAPGTLPYAASVDITLKRINGFATILWNNDVLLSGASSTSIDAIEFFFSKNTYPGANFGVLSIDYVTAVPEPATMLLFGIGSCCALLRRKRA